MKNELDYILRKNQIPIRELNEENDDNYRRTKEVLAKAATVGGAGWGISALGYQGLKYSGAGTAIGKRAGKMSTVVETFYDKGRTKRDKQKLMAQHMMNNEKDEIQKIVKRHAPMLKNEYPKMQRQIIQDEMNKYGEKTFAEHRARLDVEKHERTANIRGRDSGGYKYTTLKRAHRHEKLAQEMIDWTETGKVNVDRLRANGLSEPILTDMKTAFGTGEGLSDHSRVLTQHGRTLHPDSKISISKILDVGGDKKAIVKSVKRDAQYQMGEYVMKYADLDDPKSIEKYARERIYSMQKRSIKGFRVASANVLHEHIDDLDLEVRKFMQSFKYNKNTGIANIVLSPQYKPHYLVGGVNASVNLRKSKGRVFRQHIKGGIPSKNIKTDILISDKYDVLTNNDPFQRKVHFNVVTSRDVARISTREQLKTAIKAGKWEKAMEKALRLGTKGLIKLTRIGRYMR
jgi:hypothetical protein|tara:strand:+ start:11023 stop:12399 length:1377 start_codon:yes stop_codon:yes gene_type:complete